LIPAAIKDWYVRKDNLRQAKLAQEAATKTEIEAEEKKNTSDDEYNNEKLPLNKDKNVEQLEMILPDNKKVNPSLPNNKKDSGKKKPTNTANAFLITDDKKWLAKKTKA
jgi:hypothetical protein